MTFPFDSEGEVVVGIDAPLKGRRVIDGVEHWLLKGNVLDMRWEGDCLHFRGPSEWWRRPLASWLRPWVWWVPRPRYGFLRGIVRGKIQFHQHVDRVAMDFSFAYSRLQIWAIVPTFLLFAALGGLPIWLCLLLLPANVSIVYLLALGGKHAFQSDLRLAGIRGLADGAAQELASLQKHSPPSAAGSSVEAFQGAASC